MTAAKKIAAARELIKPLTGHTPGQWRSGDVRFGGRSQLVLHSQGNGYICEVRTPVRDNEHDYGALEANVSLIAAAPSLRDTVAALADLADAQAQENAKLKAIIAKMDAHSPRADKTCDDPGITLSEAVMRQWPELRVGPGQ